MKDILKCFVSGHHLNEKNGRGIVSFAVPEFGILFRCHADGARAELEIVAFLTFLRFAEHNLEIFKKRFLYIFSDFPLLVYLMNNGAAVPSGMEAVIGEAKKYARQISFQVKWIDPGENRAAGAVNDLPSLPANHTLKIKTFANLSLIESPEIKNPPL